MNKLLAFCFVLSLYSTSISAQKNNGGTRALGVSFILNDFTTADRIRNGSLSGVIRDDNWAKMKDMSAGLALTYFKGLQKHIDFSSTLGASFARYPMPDKAEFEKDALLLELDAMANFKMFPDNYWVIPYLSAGVGASKYRSYYGAFLPLGGGVKVNFFDEASLFVQLQYRIPVTAETTNYHFMYSVGIAGLIGRKR